MEKIGSTHLHYPELKSYCPCQ